MRARGRVRALFGERDDGPCAAAGPEPERERRGTDTRAEPATPRPRGLRGGRAGGSDLLSPPPQRPVREIRPLIRGPLPIQNPTVGAGRQGPGRGAGATPAGPCAPKASPSGQLPSFPRQPAPRTPTGPGAPHELVRPRVPHELLPLLNHLPAALLLFLDDHLGGTGRVPARCWGLRRSRGVAR